ncbi:MAG: hypothetical protein J0M16_07675 [Gammaproteobacteria bacterium]|jgi:hypothetical protein|nr:hypothetical protein [Gammaproteobacteria bacterium]
MNSLKLLVAGLLLASTGIGAAEPPATEPALPLASPAVQAEVETMIHKMSAMFTDLKGPQPLELFDRSEPAPQYLAEEQPDWMIGWDKLEWYFNTPSRKAAVQAMDMNPSNIRVRSLTPDLALATWDIFSEMKFRWSPPMGERLRANAILRKTAEGWKFIYYAEAPKSTLAYVQQMYESQATDDFKQRFAPAPAAKPQAKP